LLATLKNSVIVHAPIAGFTLMAQCKNQDGIPVFLEAIEGYIPGTPSGYHQFSQFMFHRPAYQWMAP
jgi:hypothetical protein